MRAAQRRRQSSGFDDTVGNATSRSDRYPALHPFSLRMRGNPEGDLKTPVGRGRHSAAAGVGKFALNGSRTRGTASQFRRQSPVFSEPPETPVIHPSHMFLSDGMGKEFIHSGRNTGVSGQQQVLKISAIIGAGVSGDHQKRFWLLGEGQHRSHSRADIHGENAKEILRLCSACCLITTNGWIGARH